MLVQNLQQDEPWLNFKFNENDNGKLRYKLIVQLEEQCIMHAKYNCIVDSSTEIVLFDLLIIRPNPALIFLL